MPPWLVAAALPLLLALLPLASSTPPWPHPYWDIPGDYCRARLKIKIKAIN